MRGSTTGLDVSAVLANGRELSVREDVALEGFGSYGFPTPANVALRVRRVDRGLDLSGSIAVTYVGACDRCLADVGKELRLGVSERFEPAADPLGESNVLHGDHIDLDDLVRQLVDSALPMTLLCSTKCPGLCPTCGEKFGDTCRCTPALS